MISDYLRRELRVPKYSEMYDDVELFRKETEQMFTERLGLEEKLTKLKQVVLKVT